MVVAGVQAGGKSVQPLQPVRQPVFDQKFQRAIGDRRLAAEPFGRKAVQNLVSAHRTVRFQQDFKCAAAHRCHAPAVFGKPVRRLVHGAGFAGAVIVGDEGGNGPVGVGQFCYFITIRLTCYLVTWIEAPPQSPTKGHTMRTILSTLALLAATPALAEPPRVVVDTVVTGSLVQQVMGEDAPVRVLLPKGVSPHHHQLRPSDAQGLQDADLLIWTGPELTPWLDRSAASLSEGVAQLRLLEVAGTHLRGYDGDHDHGHAHDDHDHDGTDPHAWLDPANAQVWLTAIAGALAEADPDNAGHYAENARAAGRRIAEMDTVLQSRLAPHKDAGLVVFHDAYGYFTDHYGLRPAISVSLGDASTPSAARIAAVRAEIAETGASCAFPEYASDSRLIQTAAEGTQTRMGDVLSPEGGDAAAGADLYANLMSNMAGAIDTCLSGR